MHITLDDDQQFFRDTTQRFLAERLPLTAVRALGESAAGFEESYWRQGTELGWTSFLVPEADGGGSLSANGAADLAIVADAFGHHVAAGPLLPVNVVADAVGRLGTDAQRGEVLPGLLDGSQVAAWCGWDAPLGAAPVSARPAGDGWVIEGVCGPVEAGAQAGFLLVTAVADDGPVQVLIPADIAGVGVTPLRHLDVVRRYARISFDRVEVGPERVLGAPGATGDVERQLQIALVVQTAEIVGAAQRAFDMTVEWSFDRYSFGRPLASYQELKHRFADMKLWLEASHALADELADGIGDAAASIETASVAKAYAGQFMAALAQDCIQIHGGIGLTVEHDLHLFVRRITDGRSMYGTPPQHRRRAAACRLAVVEAQERVA